jgi:hypothetical protein
VIDRKRELCNIQKQTGQQEFLKWGSKRKRDGENPSRQSEVEGKAIAHVFINTDSLRPSSSAATQGSASE